MTGGRAAGLLLAPAGLALCLALAASPADSAPKRVGGTDAWGAYQAGTGKKRVCFVHGAPQKSEGKYKRRGETYLQVSHRPAEKVRDVASVTAGYIYKKDSRVEIRIDGRKFSLFTHGDTAWGEDEKTDRALLAALKKGNEMTVRGRSSRNTLTTDSYTLAGFTRAYNAASKACKLKPR